MIQNQEKMGLTIKEASQYIGINEKKVSKLTKIKGFPCFFDGRRTVIIKQDLHSWFSKNYGKYF